MNENKTERVRVERTDAFAVTAMLIAAENNGFVRKKFTPVSDVSHLEIYQYSAPTGERLTVVYDTKAKQLTMDGKSESLKFLQSRLPMQDMPKAAPPKPSSPPQNQQQASPSAQVSQPERAERNKEQQKNHRQKLNRFPAPASKAEQPKQQQQPKQPQKVQPAQQPKQQPAPKAEQPKAEQPKQPQKAQPAPQSKVQSAPQAKQKAKAAAVPKPITVLGVTRERLDWVLMDLKTEGVKVRATDNADKSRSVAVQSRAKDSVSLMLSPSGTVTVVGKPSALLDDVTAKLTSKSDLRLLKKYLPTALRYLSEPSKIDLSNGITDLSNIGRLSDYSVLLTAPYRALEKLIYDLQQAENIHVKMIGQAYEKDDEGRYSLKKGYVKRINSVVYAEVMAALYTEYFATRNFYTHSDNSADSLSRALTDKAAAQSKLNKLLSVIEYNAKKLSEIGFTVAAEHEKEDEK